MKFWMKTMENKLQPRHLWLRDRIDSCLDAIHDARKENDFDKYRDLLNDLILECSYCANEWIKYYPDEV